MSFRAAQSAISFSQVSLLALRAHFVEQTEPKTRRDIYTIILQIRLSDVSGVSLSDRKGYLTLLLSLDKEDNLVLRRAENIRDWHDLILRLVTEVGIGDESRLDNEITTPSSIRLEQR